MMRHGLVLAKNADVDCFVVEICMIQTVENLAISKRINPTARAFSGFVEIVKICIVAWMIIQELPVKNGTSIGCDNLRDPLHIFIVCFSFFVDKRLHPKSYRHLSFRHVYLVVYAITFNESCTGDEWVVSSHQHDQFVCRE